MSRRDRDGERDRDRGRDRHERDSGSRRRRSGFDREPSPKRSRGDDKPEIEKVVNKPHPDTGDTKNQSQRDHLKLQDARSLGVAAVPSHDSRFESAEGKKEPEKNPNDHQSENLSSANPTEVPRSQSSFQVGGGYVGRGTTERGRRDSKDDRNERDRNERDINKSSKTRYSHRRDQKQGGRDDSTGSIWSNEEFFKIDDPGRPPLRRRPAFREKKNPADSETGDGPFVESSRSSQVDRQPASAGAKRGEDREHNPSSHIDRSERAGAGDRKQEGYRGFPPPNSSRDHRYVGDRSKYSRGRERLNGKTQNNNNYDSGTRVEKWKHDLFDEDAAKSPATRNEEDQIARVEALLAS